MGKMLQDQLLNKELTRKEFLKYMAGITLAVVGVSGFIDRVKNINPAVSQKTIVKEQSRGFGSSKFGV